MVVAVCLAACSSSSSEPVDGGGSDGGGGGGEGGTIYSDDDVTVTDQSPPLVHDVMQLGAALKESDDIPLDFGDDKLSVLVYAEGDDTKSPMANTVSISLRDPSGNPVLNPTGMTADELGRMGAPIRPSLDVGAASIILPQADQPMLPRGRYTLRVAGDGSVKVHIVTRRGTGAPPPGKLDVNLFLVDGCGVTAQDPVVDQVLTAMWAIFANADVQPGVVERIPITGAEAAMYVSPPAGGEGKGAPLRQLTSLASRAKNARAANAFIVKSFTGAPGLLGVSMGLPVALVVRTSTNAGTVTSIDSHRLMDSSINVPELGNTLAHEILHSMGLAHSTEESIAPNPAHFHDLFTDTPDCPASADANKDGKLTQDECMAFDGANLMFWSGNGNVAISPGQKDIVLRSAVVKRR
jgi:hypothetical protein